ncbi:transmembrane signal receptor [Lithospermum erythrorhizon]|uniref:Transmembrane signal receptor n=1 Tax=Lithospermum erythrorhizon TaxID=34254 RepID=A0AAV3Q023_LITER
MYLTHMKYISDIVKDLQLRFVGRLLYLDFTRPDITYSVHLLSQFLQKPTQSHFAAALHVVRYLKKTSGHGLFYSASADLALTSFCDSDWAKCPLTSRSITGYCVFLGGCLISWKSKKQQTVSRSSPEAEYRSAANTVCELKWRCYLLKDLQVLIALPIQLHCDKKSAITMIGNPVFHERTKYIEIDCHLIRDHYKAGFTTPTYIHTESIG